MDKNIFCCDIFFGMIMEAGKQGFSIVPTSLDETQYFVFQARSVDFNRNESSFVLQQSIHFCPWCGTKLTNIISKNADHIRKLSLKNKELII